MSDSSELPEKARKVNHCDTELCEIFNRNLYIYIFVTITIVHQKEKMLFHHSFRKKILIGLTFFFKIVASWDLSKTYQLRLPRFIPLQPANFQLFVGALAAWKFGKRNPTDEGRVL